MPDVPRLRAALLHWYDQDARDLPWRTGPAARGVGARPDPYRVWLSEVMLQQTTVSHAAPYFLAFTRRWSTVGALAAVEEGELMAAWAGLGYYARARNLLRCARAVAGEHGGAFPDTEAGLAALPGVGPYTAAAVAAIAFDRPANVVDGNVERVMARLFAVETPLPAAKPELKRLAGTLVRDERPGDWAQALMDLGATICTPRNPACDRCPVRAFCAGVSSGAPQRFPRRTRKAPRPERRGIAYVLTRGGEVALVRRPGEGLLGGMLGLPTSEWTDVAASPPPRPAPGAWREAGEVAHVFTHFSLALRVLTSEGGDAQALAEDAIWTPAAQAAQALPTVFRKVLKAALASA